MLQWLACAERGRVDLHRVVARWEVVEAEEAVRVGGCLNHGVGVDVDRRVAVSVEEIDLDAGRTNFGRLERPVVVDVEGDSVTEAKGQVEAEVDRQVGVVVTKGSVSRSAAKVGGRLGVRSDGDLSGLNRDGCRRGAVDAVVVGVGVVVGGGRCRVRGGLAFERRAGREVRGVDLDLERSGREAVEAEEAVRVGRCLRDRVAERVIRWVSGAVEEVDLHTGDPGCGAIGAVDRPGVIRVGKDAVSEAVGLEEAEVDREVGMVISG